MDQFKDLTDIFLLSMQSLIETLLIFVPKLLLALVLLLAGMLVAKLVQKGFDKLFDLIGINRIAVRSGIRDFLTSAGFHRPPSWIFARILYWLVLLAFFLPIADVLGMEFFADLVNNAIAYLPNVFVAIIIIMTGAWAAKILGGMVRGGLSRIGFEYSGAISTIINIAVLSITVIIALFQLHIEAGILSSILIIMVSALSLAFAIAFGLGAKDVVRNIMAGLYVSRAHTTGSIVNIAELQGTLVEIGTLASVIQTEDGKQISIANTRFVEGG